MDASQVADVLGALATFAALVVAGLVVLALAAPTQARELRDVLAGTGPLLAGVVALVATAGSLWFSEGAHFPPCELCWYQRIAMYPLPVLLGIAAVRRDPRIRPYALAVAGIGLAVSAWHNLIETFPSLDTGGCDPTNPCTIRWVEGLGFWTIPRMAFAAFLLIIALLVFDRPLVEEP